MLKTQKIRTKDFFVRSTHSIEHQKCKYCVGRRAVRHYILLINADLHSLTLAVHLVANYIDAALETTCVDSALL